MLEPVKISGLVDYEDLTLLLKIAKQAERVMEMLENDGASILPHLMNTDENAGQRLRDSLHELLSAKNRKKSNPIYFQIE